MTLRLLNTLTQAKEALEPRVPGRVSLYVCGPTVYDLSHIGHARCYVAFDVLVRWLKERGLQVRYVRNVTDVDDKIIQRASALGEDPLALAERFRREYEADMISTRVSRYVARSASRSVAQLGRTPGGLDTPSCDGPKRVEWAAKPLPA